MSEALEFCNWSGFGGALDMLEENRCRRCAHRGAEAGFPEHRSADTLLTAVTRTDPGRRMKCGWTTAWFARLSLAGLVR